MIEEIRVSISFSGKAFSPSNAEKITGIALSQKNEIGDLGIRGKYKGLPIPYGRGVFEPPAEIPDENKILWLASALEKTLEKFLACGAEEPYLYIGYFYKDQCNLILTKEELSVISKLGIDFHFSCYDNSDEE